MTTQPPPGQGPIDPRGAFSPPPPPFGGMPPPPMFMPPPWQPPRRGIGRTIFIVILIVGLLISILVNVVLVAVNGSSSLASNGIQEKTLVAGDDKQKIVVIPIENEMILNAQADLMSKMFDSADKDSAVKAVVLQIDTPGGSVSASDEIYHRILTYKTAHPGVPIVVTMGGVAASGGYYAACAADYLFAEPTTITGSIGVLMPQYNISGLAQKWGIQDTSIHATGADYKTAGSMFNPPDPRDTKYFTDLIDADFVQFKAVVTTGRGKRLTQPITVIANGMAYTSAQAQTLGLVDAIGYPADAYAYVSKKIGTTGMEVVKYEQSQSLIEMLTAQSTVPAPKAAGSVQINGIQINAANLDQLLTPRLLYLWRG
jgi:protease IV